MNKWGNSLIYGIYFNDLRKWPNLLVSMVNQRRNQAQDPDLIGVSEQAESRSQQQPEHFDGISDGIS